MVQPVRPATVLDCRDVQVLQAGSQVVQNLRQKQVAGVRDQQAPRTKNTIGERTEVAVKVNGFLRVRRIGKHQMNRRVGNDSTRLAKIARVNPEVVAEWTEDNLIKNQKL